MAGPVAGGRLRTMTRHTGQRVVQTCRLRLEMTNWLGWQPSFGTSIAGRGPGGPDQPVIVGIIALQSGGARLFDAERFQAAGAFGLRWGRGPKGFSTGLSSKDVGGLRSRSIDVQRVFSHVEGASQRWFIAARLHSLIQGVSRVLPHAFREMHEDQAALHAFVNSEAKGWGVTMQVLGEVAERDSDG